MTDIEEFESLVADCKAIYTEGDLVSRWVRVEMYHKIGERIYSSPYKNNRERIVTVTKMTGIKERNLYRAVQFYEMYPDLNKLPEGKNVSWHKICNDYLPQPTDKQTHEMCICSKCGREHRKATQ